MRHLTCFGRRLVGCASVVAFAGMCAALATAPAAAADLYTEPPPPPQAYRDYPPPPPAYGPPPYVQEQYVERYVPAPYYRPYRPAYRPYGWVEPGYRYPPRYVDVAPRPPAPIAGPARPWGAYPNYDEDVAQAAPPAYGYPPPPQRW
jgi:hypothetical protein